MEKKYVRNPLLRTMLALRGNQRVALMTEPLYGVMYNLYTPFAAIYMAALGLTPVQIGLIASLNMLSQMVSSLFGGVLADKFGRRQTLAFFDLLCWCVPYLLWAFADSFWWFVPAALFNGMWRISNVSFSLLVVEEADPETLVPLYSLINIASLLSGFVAPVAYLLVRSHTVVPVMRGLYLTAFALMAVKNAMVYFLCHDTGIALRKKREMKGKSLVSSLVSALPLLKRMLANPRIMAACGLMTSYLIMKNVLENFWPLYVTDTLLIPSETLSLFSTARSAVMLLATAGFTHRIRLNAFRRPLTAALCLYAAAALLYMLAPKGQFALLLPVVGLEAFSFSVLIPLSSTLLTAVLEPEERARMTAFSFVLCLLVSAPFGYILGYLSRADRVLPLCLGAVCALCAYGFTRRLSRLSLEDAKE